MSALTGTAGARRPIRLRPLALAVFALLAGRAFLLRRSLLTRDPGEGQSERTSEDGQGPAPGTGGSQGTVTYNYTNANSGPIQGGKFWRVTPTLAWYPSYEFRFTLGYGYGVLDRFGTSGGKTQFFQARIQFML